jgi:hypothetical protein
VNEPSKCFYFYSPKTGIKIEVETDFLQDELDEFSRQNGWRIWKAIIPEMRYAHVMDEAARTGATMYLIGTKMRGKFKLIADRQVNA